jgi:hypothetical protein
MHLLANRALALGGLAAGGAALLVAVLSALSGSPPAIGEANVASSTLTSRSVAFGHRRVTVHVRADGSSCFIVWDGALRARACVGRLAAGQIRYAVTRRGLGGIAGDDVRAVIVRLTHKGTVWATLRRGTFYADVPPRHRVRTLVKVVRGGKRTTFAVKANR